MGLIQMVNLTGKRYSVSEVEEHDFNLDIIWLNKDTKDNADDSSNPEELLLEIISALQDSLDMAEELDDLFRNRG